MPGADLVHHRGGFIEQRGGDQEHRQHHHQQAQQQRDQRGKVGAAAHLARQQIVQRGEDDRQDHAPEYRAEKRLKHPEEGDGDDGQQDVEGLLVHGGSVSRCRGVEDTR